MKKLILILLLFASAIFAQSELTLLFDDDNHPTYGYEYFITNDGHRLKTVDEEYFIVAKPHLYYWYFPTFIDQTDENLYYTTSTSGINNYSSLDEVYNSTLSLRDPSIIQVADTFFCIMTKNAFLNPCTSFAILKSVDLINWTAIADLEIAPDIPTANKVWAPEWFRDTDNKIYVLFSLSTQNYQTWGGVNFQTYIIEPTDSNMLTWGTPSKLTVTGETDIVDNFMYYESGTYYLFYSPHNSPSKIPNYIEVATSSTLMGTYTPNTSWVGFGSGVEGASIHKIENNVFIPNYKYIIFFDVYNLVAGKTRMGYALSNSIIDGWTAKIDLNIDFPHGTPIKINKEGDIVQ